MLFELVLDAGLGDCARRLFAVLPPSGNSTGAGRPAGLGWPHACTRGQSTSSTALAELAGLCDLKMFISAVAKPPERVRPDDGWRSSPRSAPAATAGWRCGRCRPRPATPRSSPPGSTCTRPTPWLAAQYRKGAGAIDAQVV